ncbi:argC [Symbiodinium microadriaticum]|nr:argC [Symbiodinium microadriaticum]CAE7943751.1 argC [Symbiodinium sp. KB8]
MRPLVDAGLLPAETGLVVHAVSGYSGGGKGLIKTYEEEDHEPWGAYGFALNHKHLPEMAKWTGLQEEPIFCPAVGDFKQGMVVSVPLRFSQLRAGATAADVHAAMVAHYDGKQFVSVKPLNDKEGMMKHVSHQTNVAESQVEKFVCMMICSPRTFAPTETKPVPARGAAPARWALAASCVAMKTCQMALGASALLLPRRLVRRRAVVEGDVHTVAVKKWLDSMIIGMSFCPWAGPASEANGIRIATSMANSPAAALEDLKAEAARLQGARDSTVTTLLVCPCVEPWEDFANFKDFRETELQNGEALVEEFGCKVVCFHPHSQASDSYGLQEGDDIVIRAGDGEQLCGTVLGIMPEGEDGASNLKVQFYGKVDEGDAENGEFGMQPFSDAADRVETVPEQSVLQLIGREALQDEDACRSILGRAPRIVLHLLRAADLEAVDNQKAFETLERNEEVVEAMGEEEFDRRVQECG